MTCDAHGEMKERLRAETIYQTLIEISSAVNSTYDLRELFQTIHRSLERIIDVSNLFIGIVDPRNKTIYFPFFQDEKDEAFDPIFQFRETNSLSGEVVQAGKPMLLRLADLEKRAADGRIVGTMPLIWLGVPLIIKGEVRGVMAVQSYSNADQFDQNDLEILTSVSHQIAVAIDRKMATDILRASEEKFRGFVEGTDDLVVQMDKEGVISYCNHTARRILGLTAAECIGKPIFDFIHPEEIEGFLDIYMQLLSRRRVNISVENRLVNRQTGEVRPLHWTINGQYDVQGQTVVVNAIARDLTDQKRAEEERLKVQKLESIGVLSGGIAHDFNNLLSVVMGNLDLLRGKGSLPEKDNLFIHQARQACLRAKELTWQLITFSKGGTSHLMPGNLGEVVSDCVRRALVNTSTSIDLAIDEDLWPVALDAFQIVHAIDNLLNNAIEAVSERGDIRVRVSNCQSDATCPSDGEYPPMGGRVVQLLISDTGVGIPEIHRQRIFDPYFSTKSRGAQKGMGLGLATTYTIVRKHQGEIRVWSEADKGTDVRVFFPAIAPLPAVLRTPEPISIYGGVAATTSNRVMVVDNEPTILNLAAGMLEKMGFEVMIAPHGKGAVERYRRDLDEGRVLDLVILDLNTDNGMGGLETLRQLRAMNSQVKVVVTSGYSDDPMIADPAAYGFSGALPKPYTFEELTEALEKVAAATSTRNSPSLASLKNA